MKITDLFKDLQYVGQAEGDRNIYYVFEGSHHFLVVAPSSRGYYNVNVVPQKAPEAISRTFKAKRVTVKLVQGRARPSGLFVTPFAALNALYVMVAQRRARKLKKHQGKAMLFKIRC